MEEIRIPNEDPFKITKMVKAIRGEHGRLVAARYFNRILDEQCRKADRGETICLSDMMAAREIIVS